MPRTIAVAVLFACSAVAAAAPPAPPMSAARVIDASAAGAVIAATCARGSADLHRRNAQADARRMLRERRALPADFDARFMRAWSADDRRMKSLSKAQRKGMCTRLQAQGMRFRH